MVSTERRLTSKYFWKQNVKQKQETRSRTIYLAASLQERSSGTWKMIHCHNVAKPCHRTMPSKMAEDKFISFNNILVRTEVSVESHMKVKAILRVIGGIDLKQMPLPAATNTTQTLSKMIKRQVLPASLHKKFLRQHQEKTSRH